MILRRGIYAQRQDSTIYQKINFDKSNLDYINFGTVLNGARTIEFSLTLNANVSSDDTVLGRNATNGKLFIAFNNDPSGNILKVQVDNGTGNKFVYGDNPLVVGTEYRISLRLDPTDGLRFYINGVAQTTNDSLNTALTTQTDSAYMSRFANLNIRYTSCTIRRFDVWSTSRTPAQMLAGINTVPTAGETGLIESFPFLNETGATVTGLNSGTGTINTSNAGGVTYIDNTMREIV
jgi:hypothetical protein